MSKIKIENLNKSYAAKKAVENISFEVNDGEFVTLLGPTGSGKSAVLRMIAGLDEVDGGEIYIGETLCNKLLPKDRNIAIVFKNAALYPQMSVFDNIAYSLRLRKISHPEIEARVSWAANIMGVGDCLLRKPKTLFGPQKMRVAFARAIVREPQAILFDEPFSDLDKLLTQQMRAEIVKLQKRLKYTFLYATRNQIEALTVSDRIIVMNEGKIEQIDTPRNLYLNPKTVFVATYIGSPMVNLAIAKLTKADEQTFVEFGNSKLALPKTIVEKIKDKDAFINTDKLTFLGIRSEFLSFNAEGDIEGKIESLEDMGGETLYSVSVKGATDTWTVRAESGLYKPSEAVKLSIDLDKALLFDKESEITLYND